MDGFTEMVTWREEQTWGDYLEFRSTPEGSDSILGVLFGSDYAGKLPLTQGWEEVMGARRVAERNCWALLPWKGLE